MLLYIAGPMTGIPQKNFPAFYAAAAVLQAMGHTTLNPADNEAGGDLSWEEYMEIDKLDVIKSDGIVLLPGWENSKGARMEFGWAQEMGKGIFHLSGDKLIPWISEADLVGSLT